MDAIYSGSLALAMFAVASAFVLALTRRARHIATMSVLAAFAFLAVSVLSHLAFGHRPGTPQALGLPAFFVEHPAFAVTGLAAGVILSTLRWSRDPVRSDRKRARL